MLPVISFKDITQKQVNPPLIVLKAPSTDVQGIQLQQSVKDVLQPQFVYMIQGKPNAGKSWLIQQMLENPSLFHQKFHRIIYVGPTRYKSVIHDSFNTKSQIDVQWILNHANMCSGWAKNMLLVMDDIISQIPSHQRNSLQQLIYNRRHLIENGCISILFTSQNYMSTPAWLRSVVTGIFSFKMGPQEVKHMCRQHTLNKQAKLLSHYNNQLGPHHFLYMNCNTGKVYNDNFNQI